MSARGFQAALTLHLQGQHQEAWSRYQSLAPRCHHSAAYWFWLGLLAFQLQYKDEARQCLHQAGALQYFPPPEQEIPTPFFLDILLYRHLCGGLSLESGLQAMRTRSRDEQLSFWELCLQSQLIPLETLAREVPPDWAPGRYWLGMRLLMNGQPEGQTILQELAAQKPPYLDAQIALGHLALEQGRLEEALERYESILAEHPQLSELRFHLGKLYRSNLRLAEAKATMQQAIEEHPNPAPLWELQRNCLYSPLPTAETPQTLENLRIYLRSAQQSIALEAVHLDLQRNGLEPLFDLLYLSEQELPLRSAFGDVFISPPASPPDKARTLSGMHLGVVVTPGHENIFWSGSQLLLEALMHSGVQISLFCAPSALFPQNWGGFPRFQQHALSPNLKIAAEQIRQQACDLLYYWESGTDALNFALPYYQAAPVQFTSWGSVATTGHPHMDYFLSTPELDPHGQRFYREKLVQMPRLPILFRAPRIQARKSRAFWQLPSEAILLGIPHNPLKFSDAFLECLGQILSQRPEARAVAIESRHPSWQAQIQARLQRQLGASAAQLIWLPRQKGEDFLNLLVNLDFILDPFPFGSGKICFEALSLGTPILSLSGDRLRSRIVHASYVQMGWTELLCASPQAYVHKALDLIDDREFLQRQREAVYQRHLRVIQHPECLPGFMNALVQMAQT